ncbi:hypothetical protein TNCT_41811 [Trichonephila clavata]|uniref:Uncharacterized protein n=1 Tax=Trichonephila clavata TaxID=2740835 RepID=A0A8X6I1P5_TRICU|nr:hypothetical protein TNCT_41811 [Trichonephila clavata]
MLIAPTARIPPGHHPFVLGSSERRLLMVRMFGHRGCHTEATRSSCLCPGRKAPESTVLLYLGIRLNSAKAICNPSYLPSHRRPHTLQAAGPEWQRAHAWIRSYVSLKDLVRRFLTYYTCVDSFYLTQQSFFTYRPLDSVIATMIAVPPGEKDGFL